MLLRFAHDAIDHNDLFRQGCMSLHFSQHSTTEKESTAMQSRQGPLPRGKNASLTNMNDAIANLQRNMAKRTPPGASAGGNAAREQRVQETAPVPSEAPTDSQAPLSANAKSLVGEINNFDLFANRQFAGGKAPAPARSSNLHAMPTPSPPKMGRPPGEAQYTGRTPPRAMPGLSGDAVSGTSTSGQAITAMSCGDDEPIPMNAPMMSDSVMQQHQPQRGAAAAYPRGGAAQGGTDTAEDQYGTLDEGPYHGSVVRLLSPDEQRAREEQQRLREEHHKRLEAEAAALQAHQQSLRPVSAGVGTQSMPAPQPQKRQAGTLLKPPFVESMRRFSTYLYFDTLCAERDMAVNEEAQQQQYA